MESRSETEAIILWMSVEDSRYYYSLLVELLSASSPCWSLAMETFNCYQMSSASLSNPQPSMCATLWQRAPISTAYHPHCQGCRWWEKDVRSRFSLWVPLFPWFPLVHEQCIFTADLELFHTKETAFNVFLHCLSWLCKI